MCIYCPAMLDNNVLNIALAIFTHTNIHTVLFLHIHNEHTLSQVCSCTLKNNDSSTLVLFFSHELFKGHFYFNKASPRLHSRFWLNLVLSEISVSSFFFFFFDKIREKCNRRSFETRERLFQSSLWNRYLKLRNCYWEQLYETWEQYLNSGRTVIWFSWPTMYCFSWMCDWWLFETSLNNLSRVTFFSLSKIHGKMLYLLYIGRNQSQYNYLWTSLGFLVDAQQLCKQDR